MKLVLTFLIGATLGLILGSLLTIYFINTDPRSKASHIESELINLSVLVDAFEDQSDEKTILACRIYSVQKQLRGLLSLYSDSLTERDDLMKVARGELERADAKFESNWSPEGNCWLRYEPNT